MQPFKLPAGYAWHHVAETSSTMRHIAALPDPPGARALLLTTDYQTAGHGQRGTSWESAPALNLLFTLRLRPTFMAPAAQFLLSEAAALAVAEALAPHVGGITLKWPNDVYAGHRKICGMLLQHRIEGTHIAETLVGPGININQPHFTGDAPNPVSLLQLTGRTTPRETVLEAFLSRFDHYYRLLSAGRHADIHNRYMQRLYRREGYHPYRDTAGPFLARIAGVEPAGRLCLLDETGRLRRYAFKEVSFIPSL